MTCRHGDRRDGKGWTCFRPRPAALRVRPPRPRRQRCWASPCPARRSQGMRNSQRPRGGRPERQRHMDAHADRGASTRRAVRVRGRDGHGAAGPRLARTALRDRRGRARRREVSCQRQGLGEGARHCPWARGDEKAPERAGRAAYTTPWTCRVPPSCAFDKRDLCDVTVTSARISMRAPALGHHPG